MLCMRKHNVNNVYFDFAAVTTLDRRYISRLSKWDVGCSNRLVMKYVKSQYFYP